MCRPLVGRQTLRACSLRYAATAHGVCLLHYREFVAGVLAADRWFVGFFATLACFIVLFILGKFETRLGVERSKEEDDKQR